MPRRIRSSLLENRTNRLKLAAQRKPYWITIAPGISLGYRRLAGPGSWNVRCADGRGGNWIKGLDAFADDHETANGGAVLDFWQAGDKAKALARAGDDQERPVTVDEALAAYEADLVARSGDAGNVGRVRKSLPSALAARSVTLVTARELRLWRNSLVKTGTKPSSARRSRPVKAGVKPASADRTARALAAALTLASPVTNAAAWKVGLKRLPGGDEARQNSVLPDETVREIVKAAHEYEAAFGLLVETLAVTGARAGQLLRLTVADLEDSGGDAEVAGAIKPEGAKPQGVAQADPDLAGTGGGVTAGRW